MMNINNTESNEIISKSWIFSNNEVPLSQGYDDSFNQSLQNALFNLSKTGQKELIMSSQFREHTRYAINIWLLHIDYIIVSNLK